MPIIHAHILAIVREGTPSCRSSFVMSRASRTAKRVPLDLAMQVSLRQTPPRQHSMPEDPAASRRRTPKKTKADSSPPFAETATGFGMTAGFSVR